MSLEISNIGQVRVLVVDDEPALRMLAFAMIMGFKGYEPVSLGNPEEALTLIEQDPNRFQVLLTDLEMPEMNGVSLAGRVRKVSPMGIIIASGNPVKEVQRQDSDGVADFILHKPFRIADLQAALDQTLDSYRKRLTPPQP